MESGASWSFACDIYVEGVVDIEDGASMTLVGSSLTTNSTFDLNGELNVGSGEAIVNADFDLSNTGILSITSGSFTEAAGIYWTSLNGELNLTGDGFFKSFSSLLIGSNADITISDGFFQVRNSFEANNTDVFQPTGGTVEFFGSGTSTIDCSSGNYFHNLLINKDPGEHSYICEHLDINNDMIIDSGIFRVTCGMSSYDIYIAGDWTNNSGVANFAEGVGTVTFGGNSSTSINTDEEFYNLLVDKTNPGSENLMIDSGKTVTVSNDLDIDDGKLMLFEDITLEIGNSLNVSSGGKLDTGANDDACVITRVGTGIYAFNVESGGTIDASSTIFEYIDANGVNVKSGAIIDATSLFWDCTFRNGTAGGTLLTIDNDQILTLDELYFYAGSRDSAYNVTKNVDEGEITFTNTGGTFDGPDYEDDPYNRLHWSGFSAPIVTTDTITNIDETTATGGGNVTVDSGSFVTARGVCWSKSSNPTIADDFTDNGTGTGAFVSSITGLDPDTHYYVRAYATNGVDTSYGNEVEFITTSSTPPGPPSNLTIAIVGTDVVVSWDAVPGATSYKVYSSDKPDSGFTEDTTGVFSSEMWTAPASSDKKFYYVKAVTSSRNNSYDD